MSSTNTRQPGPAVGPPSEAKDGESSKRSSDRVGSQAHSARGNRDSSTSSSGQKDDQSKDRILAAALKHVPVHGWSVEALHAGAADLALSPAVSSMYARGPIELVEHFYVDCNRRLHNKFVENNEFIKDMRTVDKLKTATRLRLQMLLPVLDHWPQAMAMMALPQNVPYTLCNVGSTLDEIWHVSGDRSTDISWYTKRAVLGSIYGATELYLLTDQSADKAQSWDFLHRSIDNATQLSQLPIELQRNVQSALDLVSRAFWPPSQK